MGLGLSTRQLTFVNGIAGFLFLGRLLDFAALRTGVYLVLGVVVVVLLCWMIHDIMAARRSVDRPEHKKSNQNDVLIEFAGLGLAILILVFIGGL